MLSYKSQVYWCSKSNRSLISLDIIVHHFIKNAIINHNENTSVCSATPPSSTPRVNPIRATALCASRIKDSGPLAQTATPPPNPTQPSFEPHDDFAGVSSISGVLGSGDSDLGSAKRSSSKSWIDGLTIVMSELGMWGIASGSQIHVTKTEMWRSNDVPNAVFAISISIGMNHSMEPAYKNLRQSL